MRMLPAWLAALVVSSAFGADLSGYWMFDARRSDAWPADVQLTAAASDRVKHFDPTSQDPTRICMPFGMPRVMSAVAASPMEIVQTERQVTLLFDSHDEIRRVFIGQGKPEAERVESWLGYSTGRWEGEVLVVQTTHVYEATLATASGVPHSPGLRITERLQVTDGGRALRNEMTLTDPASFVRPVTRRLIYMRGPETQSAEFHCTEQMWLDHVMSRAKELTRELAQQKKPKQ